MLVIYHDKCRDGFAAAWAIRDVYRAGEKECIFIPGNYGSLPKGYPFRGQDVVFADFCLSRDNMVEIAEAAASLLVLDHHKTAEEALANFPQSPSTLVVFDMNRSGAGIAWDHYNENPFGACPDCGSYCVQKPTDHVAGCENKRPWFINYVEDRDLWRFALPDSKAINAYLGTLQYDFEEWDALRCMLPSEAMKAGAAVERKTDAYVTEVCKNSYTMDSPLGLVRVVNAPQVDISEVLAELLKIYPEATFSCGWWRTSNGKFSHGLRSRPGSDVDISAVAKAFGGGGHKHAAGFQIDSPVSSFE